MQNINLTINISNSSASVNIDINIAEPAKPIITETIETESIITEPIETETIITETIETKPIVTETIETKPIVTETIDMVPIVTETIDMVPIDKVPMFGSEEEKIFKKSLNGTSYDIAEWFMFNRKCFKCASIKYGIWYEFKNHRWTEIDSAYTLINSISEELVNDYLAYSTYLVNKLKFVSSCDRQFIIENIASASKIVKKLCNSIFKNTIIKECCLIAFDPYFIKRLDENKDLICFENGVYDLYNKKFRDGKPNDYISLCTNYKYVPYDKETNNIKKLLRQIIPDKIVRKYLLTILSTCITASNPNEDFYILTGSNSKNIIMQLLKYALGDLYKAMDILVLVGKRTSSSTANPELADKKGIRVCSFDEPMATHEINEYFINLVMKQDMAMTTALFREPIYFNTQFKPFLVCDKMPMIESKDDGLWRRIKVIRLDTIITEQITNEMGQELMSLLINKFDKNKLVHPAYVIRETQIYHQACINYNALENIIGAY